MFARPLFRLAAGLVSLTVVSSTPVSARSSWVGSAPPMGSVEQFVKACSTRLDLTSKQRVGLRTYLEQEIDYMAVQSANHSAEEVAQLVPAERAQLQQVAGKLLSPEQLRQFQELEATPKMQVYLRQMALGI